MFSSCLVYSGIHFSQDAQFLIEPSESHEINQFASCRTDLMLLAICPMLGPRVDIYRPRSDVSSCQSESTFNLSQSLSPRLICSARARWSGHLPASDSVQI